MLDEFWQIIGIVVSILGVLGSVGIAFYLKHLDGKRRRREETFYVTTTVGYIQQLKDHLISIQNISEDDDTIPEMEVRAEITRNLVNYGGKNKQQIESLISRTQLSMSNWMSLASSEKRDVESFIATVNWVLENYLPKHDESDETQTRRWSSYLEEFQERKNNSIEKINYLLRKYG